MSKWEYTLPEMTESSSARVLPVLPKDGNLIALIMKSMGIHECEPQTIPQLLEFIYRHCTEALQDAYEVAEHVHHKKITLDDLRYVIQSRASRSFVLPPSREVSYQDNKRSCFNHMFTLY